MKNSITIRPAATEEDRRFFREQLTAYFQRDIFPDPGHPDRAYFLGPEYRERIEGLRSREEAPCRFLLFRREGRDIGFALTVLYAEEEGKCFLLEFCVFPEFRGNGTGSCCAQALLDWERARGAAWFALNCGEPRRVRFWKRLGFVENGRDRWGEPLLLLPPEEDLPFTVERLRDPEDEALPALENSFRAAVGEEPLTEEGVSRLRQGVREGRIAFFFLRRGSQAVGMCSAASVFSTFACGETGVFEDFYILPAFRKKGGARLLAEAARRWQKEQGMASLTVTCAPCDREMYRALGFGEELGETLAAL